METASSLRALLPTLLLALGFALAVALFPANAEAQLRFGASGGVSIADISSDEVEETESVTGADVGLDVYLGLGGPVSLRSGVRYVQKGVETRFVDDGVGIDVELGLDYVEIPLLLQADFRGDGPFGVHLHAGPTIAFETSCDVDLRAAVGDQAFTFEGDCDEQAVEFDGIETESVDFGILLGGGVGYVVSERFDLFGEVTYDIGLVDVFAEDGIEAKNRALGIRAGFSIAAGGR